MKIIRHGTLFREEIRFTCPKCECIFEEEEGEYVKTSDSNSITVAITVCPECGHSVSRCVKDEDHED